MRVLDNMCIYICVYMCVCVCVCVCVCIYIYIYNQHFTRDKMKNSAGIIRGQLQVCK